MLVFQGSERLLQLVSDSSASQNSSVAIVTKNNSHGDSEDVMRNPSSPWVGVLSIFQISWKSSKDEFDRYHHILVRNIFVQ